ncbi:tagatose-bisphosphate aldolase [Lactobacillus plantarum subsp. plantarum] [Lactiplantibacillus mudanjiangensis]|uniref:hypothetical protein n=1 Tax=Lactiplantibacillus mudanjiangensis TaxID=1296538 RepID=UPI001014C30B|nr:hypothetical protein [Lactiplantibacillus mudanjiangensis]VDG31501.1 tagatose-bisphosphate aldolase [Lactobacillus plantarum subsp. plantarum] [Lactiplantibacillus mudanjiangensis]
MNRVELALQQRKQSILTANENELLTSIAYATTTKVVKKDSAKRYMSDFFGELSDGGITIVEPQHTIDHKWHFVLPDPGMITDED